MAEAVSKPIAALPTSTSRVEALLRGPSIAERAVETGGALCAATPSIAPGVIEAMTCIAEYERSVSAAGLALPDGSSLGAFDGRDGVFAHSRALGAELYGADDSLILVAGSTSGNQIISKLLAARGATTLTVANAHHSTILALTEDRVDYLRLEVGYDTTFEAALAPSTAQIAGTLRLFPAIDAVWITSPSYEGDVADVAAIAEVCHSNGAILIVDAAWGAHFPFHPDLPEVPCALGADIAVTSLHKLGGGPQGTALLAYRTARVSSLEVEDAQKKVVTTSPSMVLLGGADAAMREMATHGTAHLQRTFNMGSELVARAAADLPKLKAFVPRSASHRDPTRVTFATHGYGMAGYELSQALALRGIVCEKAGTNAITFLMAMGLPDDAPQRIVGAMREALIGELRPVNLQTLSRNPFFGTCSVPACTPWLARRLGRKLGRRVALEDAAGWIATEMLEVYPPGIPVIVPGFPIGRGAVDVVRDALRLGGCVQSTGASNGRLTVISARELAACD